MYMYVCAEMGQKAAELALTDAGVDYGKVQAVAASYCYGDPTSGKQVIAMPRSCIFFSPCRPESCVW